MTVNKITEIVQSTHKSLIKDLFSNEKITERNKHFVDNDGKIPPDKMSIVALSESQLYASNLLNSVLVKMSEHGYFQEPN